MHAAVAPAVRARWELKDVPVSDPGPNQVLIRIRASGLCYTDVHRAGQGALPRRDREQRPMTRDGRAL
jgi:D-arabinose 1-dehydrogenase-like Zn-dependent alcohol dehydrogenase